MVSVLPLHAELKTSVPDATDSTGGRLAELDKECQRGKKGRERGEERKGPLSCIQKQVKTMQGFIQDLQFGGGGELKKFGVYVLGVHKQAPSREVWAPPPPPDFFFCKIDAIRLILTQLHLATESSDTIASCHRNTIIIRKANHRIIAHGLNILDEHMIEL